MQQSTGDCLGSADSQIGASIQNESCTYRLPSRLLWLKIPSTLKKSQGEQAEVQDWR